MRPDPMQTMLGRLGYTRTDTAGQALDLRPEADMPVQPTYPQVVMIQGQSTGETWVRDHAGQLLLAAGVGVFAMTALLVIALVAIVTAIAMVTCVTALAIAKAAATSQGHGRRNR